MTLNQSALLDLGERLKVADAGVMMRTMLGEDVPSSVELRWRPDDHQAALTW